MFQLSRSVRQGCALAPYLSLFVAEAMGYFLQATSQGTLGLFLPIRQDHELLDTEFVDDTASTVRGDQHALSLASLSIDKFCLASGGLVNWNKSKGFWTNAQKDMPA